MAVIRHGEPPCICTAAGEDPLCPIHGYEAVIARMRDENESLLCQLEGAVEALEQIAEYHEHGRHSAVTPASLAGIARRAIDRVRGQS